MGSVGSGPGSVTQLSSFQIGTYNHERQHMRQKCPFEFLATTCIVMTEHNARGSEIILRVPVDHFNSARDIPR